MSDLSRRKILASGGTLGALGVASPAVAWTWSPKGSVAGTGTGRDPRWVWDKEGDPIVAALQKQGKVPEVNEALRNWTKNDHSLPDGLPADLRNFMQQARQLPSWADQSKLDAAVGVTERWGLYLGVLYGMQSGMMSTVIPKEARAVYYSYGGSHMKDRISKTAKLGYDIGASNAYKPDGEMIVTCVKTRLVHAGVRDLLPRSKPWQGAAPEEIPISQADQMVTWHSLATSVWRKLTEWEVPISAEEFEAYLHSWQVSAHMLGIKDEYIPATWEEADAQAKQVLDPVLTPTPEGVELADILIGLAADIDGEIFTRPILGSVTRYMLGDEIAEWLKIPREPFWDSALNTFWIPFVRVREGVQDVFPGADNIYWMFEEFIRKFVLLFLGGLNPINIEIPTTNR